MTEKTLKGIMAEGFKGKPISDSVRLHAIENPSINWRILNMFADFDLDNELEDKLIDRVYQFLRENKEKIIKALTNEQINQRGKGYNTRTQSRNPAL